MKVAFTTLGCRTNQHDTAEMQTLLENEGYAIVGPGERADVYVVNTCSVTARSDYNSRLAVKKSLAINENALVVFTGCYAQLAGDEAASIEGLDLILGNANKLEIVDAIRQNIQGRTVMKNTAGPAYHMTDILAEREFRSIPVGKFFGKTKAFIKVQTGCDEKCSFCTVVRARGRSISDHRANILANVRQAIDAGFKEITLTGINLGTWGMDLAPRETFSSLVEQIAGLEGTFRVRLSSINPMEIDDALIDLMAHSDKLCPHLHIPLQSGDDEVLRRMRRNYTSGQYIDAVQRAVEKIPGLGLGADVIVGFPGETEAAFERTRALIDALPFSYLHVFTYSPRKGTEAYGMRSNLPKTEKKQRNRILTELARGKSDRFRRRLLDQTVTVLFETPDASGKLKGYSEHYVPVTAPAGPQHVNKLVPVTLSRLAEGQVLGCLA